MIGQAARDPRIRTPVLFWLVVMMGLSAQRLAVLLLLRGRFADVSAAEIARGFLIGLRFDACIACTLTVPLVILLATAWPRVLARPGFQYAVAAYGALVGALLAFLFVADYYFFEEFNERLNHKALDYLAFPATYGLIWQDYPVIRTLLATLVVLAVLFWVARRVAFPRAADGRSWRRLAIWLGVAIPLLLIGVRGGAGPMAINSAPAYFSTSQSLSQLTLNGAFTLREALVSRTIGATDLSRCATLLPQEEAFALATSLLARPNDHFLGQPDNPLRRVTDTGQPEQRYNVVLVMLESLSWPYVGALGGEPDLTPNFSTLAREAVLMERCFAVGCRTSRAMAGIASGYPDLPGASVTTRSEAQHNFLTLAEVLRRRGYQTTFIYGGQPTWDHLQAFLRSNGFERTLFEDDFEVRTFRTVLGWCDEDLFAQTHRELVALGDQPFFTMLLTLSFHRPFEIPPVRVGQVEPNEPHIPEYTCARYVDWAIHGFLEQARTGKYFDRTIFVFVADHRGEFLGRDHTPAGYRVPFLIYAPAVLGTAGRRVSTICSQTDIAPTIMALLGGSYEHSFFGSNVLDRADDAGMALMQDGANVFWFMGANGDVVQIPFGAEPRLWRYTAPGTTIPVPSHEPAVLARRDELRRQAVALLQSAAVLFERGSYNLPKSE